MLAAFLLMAIAASAGPVFSAAELIVSALDPQGQSVHQHVRKLPSGAGIDLLDRGAGDLHEITALLLGKPLFVDEPDGLILVHRQYDCRFAVSPVFRRKSQRLRKIAHSPAFSRPWQGILPPSCFFMNIV